LQKWRLKTNVETTKNALFKKGGKLSKNDKWTLETVGVEAINKKKKS
jgi:hypothetical protein